MFENNAYLSVDRLLAFSSLLHNLKAKLQLIIESENDFLKKKKDSIPQIGYLSNVVSVNKGQLPQLGFRPATPNPLKLN